MPETSSASQLSDWYAQAHAPPHTTHTAHPSPQFAGTTQALSIDSIGKAALAWMGSLTVLCDTMASSSAAIWSAASATLSADSPWEMLSKKARRASKACTSEWSTLSPDWPHEQSDSSLTYRACLYRCALHTVSGGGASAPPVPRVVLWHRAFYHLARPLPRMHVSACPHAHSIAAAALSWPQTGAASVAVTPYHHQSSLNQHSHCAKGVQVFTSTARLLHAPAGAATACSPKHCMQMLNVCMKCFAGNVQYSEYHRLKSCWASP